MAVDAFTADCFGGAAWRCVRVEQVACQAENNGRLFFKESREDMLHVGVTYEKWKFGEVLIDLNKFKSIQNLLGKKFQPVFFLRFCDKFSQGELSTPWFFVDAYNHLLSLRLMAQIATSAHIGGLLSIDFAELDEAFLSSTDQTEPMGEPLQVTLS